MRNRVFYTKDGDAIAVNDLYGLSVSIEIDSEPIEDHEQVGKDAPFEQMADVVKKHNFDKIKENHMNAQTENGNGAAHNG